VPRCRVPGYGIGAAEDPRGNAGLQARHKSFLEHQQARAAVADVVVDLRPHGCGVDRHRHRADPAAGEEGLELLDAVRAHQRDAVAARDARGAQRARAARHRFERIAVAPGAAGNVEQRPVAEALRRAAQHRRQRALGRR
jgi:hypothetical protein